VECQHKTAVRLDMPVQMQSLAGTASWFGQQYDGVGVWRNRWGVLIEL